MVSVEFKLRGEQKVIAKLKKLAREEPQAVGRALYEEGENIMTEAKRLTPVDTGALRASGHVELPEFGADGISVTLGFGGAAAPYAVHVHENLGAYHKPPTQAKFLEQPFRAAQAGMVGRLARKLKEWLGR